MILIVVKFKTRPEWSDRFMDLVRDFTQATRAEPGNLWFEWSRSVDDPDQFFLVEAFADDGAAPHVTSEHFQRAIREMPKAELHLHIEGTLEPELKLELAARNGIRLPYDSIEALRSAYAFDDLPSFLAVYYEGMSVLLHEPDFYDLAMAYFRRAASQHVVYAEVFFDPQAHTSRGIAFSTVMSAMSEMVNFPTRVESAAGFSRLPLHARHGVSAMYDSIHSRIHSDSVCV